MSFNKPFFLLPFQKVDFGFAGKSDFKATQEQSHKKINTYLLNPLIRKISKLPYTKISIRNKQYK